MTDKIKKVRLFNVFKPGEFDQLKKLILRGKNPMDYLKRSGFTAKKGPEDAFLPDTLGDELWVFKRNGMTFCMVKVGSMFDVASIHAITPAQTDGEKP